MFLLHIYFTFMAEALPFYEPQLARQLIDIRSMNHEQQEMSADIELAVNLMELEIQRKGVNLVTVEGPPIYLWRNDQVTSCAWDNEAFRKGWELTDQMIRELRRRMPGLQVEHFQMIDDKNYRPNTIPPTNTYENSFDRSMAEAEDWRRFHEEVAENIPVPSMLEAHYGKMESVFMEDQDDTCAMLDSRFQLEKIMEGQRNGTALHIIVHPEDFQRQQAAMLANLKGQFAGNPDLQHIPKKMRDQMLRDSYRHVWIGSTGQVSNITEPVVNNGMYSFQPILQEHFQLV